MLQQKSYLKIDSCRDTIRKEKREERRNIPLHTQLINAKKIALQISKLRCFLEAKNIASYISSDGEIDTTNLHDIAWSKNKNIFLPQIQDSIKLSFFYFKEGEKLKNGPWGTFEIESPRIEKKLSEMDLIIVPMVAFDKNGNRLGRGGGFYDRVLSESNITSKNKIYGLAHDIQEIERIPIKENDIPMDGIITPYKIIDF